MSGAQQACRYDEKHRKVLEKALRRHRLLAHDEPAPAPLRQFTGVAGVSCLYLVELDATNGVLRTIMAKFDEKARAATGWLATTNLSERKGGLPSGILVPFNDSTDGVMLFDAVHGFAGRGRVDTLAGLMLGQLTTNPSRCVEALDRALTVIEPLHLAEPGSDASLGLTWSRSFPKLAATIPGLRAAARRIPGVRLDGARLRVDALGNLTVPDPFAVLERRLDDLAGKIWRGRIHGDPNLTNFLLALDDDYCVESTFVIDWERSRTNSPVAIDLARIESELWQETYVDLAGDLGGFVAARQLLDGLATAQPRSPIAQAMCSVVTELRRHARRRLGRDEPYNLNDYHASLYFTCLQSLGFPSVTASPAKTTLALVGAALSCQVLDDLASGRRPGFIVPPPSAPPPPNPAPRPIDREHLLRQLTALLPGAFEEVVVCVGAPTRHLPSTHASLSERATALLQWAHSRGGGLERLAECIERAKE